MTPQDYTKQFEGFRDKPYKDTVGKRTVGYGFNLDDPTVAKMVPKAVSLGLRPISKTESDNIFNVLYARAQNDAVKYIGKDNFGNLNPKTQSTLVDMSYNMGYNKLSEFKKFKAALIEGDMNKAAAEMKDSTWFKQVGNRSQFHYNVIKNSGTPVQNGISWGQILKGLSK